MVQFTVSGHRVELTADDVRHRLSGTRPERIYEYSIRVGPGVYPVKQAFEVATGIPRSEFTTQTARRHLAALGFVIGSDGSGGRPSSSYEASARANIGNATEASGQSATSGDWHTEANVQAMVVAYLEREGWQIESQADTESRQRGIDIVAKRQTEELAIEVKGFPGRGYADPPGG